MAWLLPYAVTGTAGIIVLMWYIIKKKYPWLQNDFTTVTNIAKALLLLRKMESTVTTPSIKLAENAKIHPDRKLFLFEDETWTYKQIHNWANRCARSFKSLGIAQRDKIGIFMMNEPAFVALWMGCIRIGATAAFLNFNLRSKALLHCIDVADVKIVIVGDIKLLIDAIKGINAELKDRGITVMVYGAATVESEYKSIASVVDLQSSEDTPTQWIEGIKHGDPLCYVYTSGTTGLPKAVEVNIYKFWAGANLMTMIMPKVTKDDVIYISLPLYHSSASFIGFGGALLCGYTIALRQKFSASQFWPDCRKFGVTIVQYIGETMRYVCNQPMRESDKVHTVRAAIGNGLRPDVWRIFLDRYGSDIHMVEFYGSTEGNFLSINLFNHFGCVGMFSPLIRAVGPGKIVKFDTEKEEIILDKNGKAILVNCNEPGLLITKITSNLKISNYKGNKSLTEKKILKDVFKRGDRFFNTGDILMHDDKHLLSFCDRVGDTFRWKGENVSTNEVSDTVLALPGISEANTYGVQISNTDGRAGMAAIVLAEADKFNLKALYEHVCNNLPSYARPIFIRVLSELELTGTYKQSKVVLKKEGYDLDIITEDKIYFLDNKVKSYVPFTRDIMNDINTGTVKV